MFLKTEYWKYSQNILIRVIRQLSKLKNIKYLSNFNYNKEDIKTLFDFIYKELKSVEEDLLKN